jgi:hypothetical protein
MMYVQSSQIGIKRNTEYDILILLIYTSEVHSAICNSQRGKTVGKS